MALNPMTILIVIVGTMTFNALFTFTTQGPSAFGITTFPTNSCVFQGGGGFLDIQAVGNALGFVGCIGVFIATAVTWFFVGFLGPIFNFLFSAITFGFPGTPLLVRFILGSTLGFGLVWSIATLLRGN